MKKATQQQSKEHNRNLALKTIFEHSSISRAEIARLTGLTRTTVSDIVADLIDEGLVEEVGIGASQGGKSPILLEIVPDSRYIIGLDLAHSQFRGAIVNLRGQIRELVATPLNDRDGEGALAILFDMLDHLYQAQYRPLIGIGVGTPGLVNTGAGLVINAVNLDWRNLPLAELVQSRYPLPVAVLNDSQAAAMAEFTYGKGHNVDSHLVVINVQHGIGSGIILNGRLFQGDGGGAGEIGHIVVVPEGGQACRCGKHGCLETVASAQAILQRVREIARQSPGNADLPTWAEINLDTLINAFLAGNPTVRRIVVEAGRALGLAISSLVGTLNIHNIILRGEVTRFGPLWLEAVRDTARQYSLTEPAQDTRIEIGESVGEGVILGASAMLAGEYSLLFLKRTADNYLMGRQRGIQ